MVIFTETSPFDTYADLPVRDAEFEAFRRVTDPSTLAQSELTIQSDHRTEAAKPAALEKLSHCPNDRRRSFFVPS
jgi:hypothetical protein